jgi:hypothetical protein
MLHESDPLLQASLAKAAALLHNKNMPRKLCGAEIPLSKNPANGGFCLTWRDSLGIGTAERAALTCGAAVLISNPERTNP